MNKKEQGNNSFDVVSREQLNILLKFILRAVVKFCLRHGVRFQQISDLLKDVFVSEGVAQLDACSAKFSVSKLAVMTGVHRKDITAILAADKQPVERSDILTKIVGQWLTDSRFSKKKGVPKLLPISLDGVDFVSLVQSVSKEINPYTILFELERLNMVSREGALLHLRVHEYIARCNPVQGFELLSLDIDDLLNVVDENVFSENPEHHHLATRYDNVCPEYFERINKWIIKEGAKFHKKARLFFSKFDKDINTKLKKKPGGGKVSLGSFGYINNPKG